ARGRDRHRARPRLARAGAAAALRCRRVAHRRPSAPVGVAEAMNGRALVALALGLAVAGCGCGTKTVTQTTTVVHTTTVRVTTSTPPSSGASEACTGNATSGTFKAIAGSAGAGNVSYRLRVVNASPVACYVSGLPQVQLIGSDGNDVPTS